MSQEYVPAWRRFRELILEARQLRTTETYTYDAKDFSFSDPKIRENSIFPVFQEHLRLIDEAELQYDGRIVVVTESQTGKLKHICVGRAVVLEETGEQMYIGLRFSPPVHSMRFDSWPILGDPRLHRRVPPDHRAVGLILRVPGELLLDFADGFNLKYKYSEE